MGIKNEPPAINPFLQQDIDFHKKIMQKINQQSKFAHQKPVLAHTFVMGPQVTTFTQTGKPSEDIIRIKSSKKHHENLDDNFVVYDEDGESSVSEVVD